MQIADGFFLEHAGELRIIILEEKGRARDRLQNYLLTPYTPYTTCTEVTMQIADGNSVIQIMVLL
jgi:hypothetical protein